MFCILFKSFFFLEIIKCILENGSLGELREGKDINRWKRIKSLVIYIL